MKAKKEKKKWSNIAVGEDLKKYIISKGVFSETFDDVLRRLLKMPKTKEGE